MASEIKRFFLGFLASTSEKIGRHEKTVTALADCFPSAMHDVADCVDGLTLESRFHLTIFLWGSLVVELFGNLIGVRAMSLANQRAGLDQPDVLERHKRFDNLVNNLTKQGAQFSAIRQGSADYSIMLIYMATKVAISMSSKNEPNIHTLDEVAIRLQNRMPNWVIQLRHVKGFHESGLS